MVQNPNTFHKVELLVQFAQCEYVCTLEFDIPDLVLSSFALRIGQATVAQINSQDIAVPESGSSDEGLLSGATPATRIRGF